MTLVDNAGNITVTTTGIPNDTSIYNRLFTLDGITVDTVEGPFYGSFSSDADTNTYWLIPFGDTIPCQILALSGSSACTCGKTHDDGSGTGLGMCCESTTQTNCCDNCGCDGSCNFIVAIAGGGPGKYYALTWAHCGVVIGGKSMTYNGTYY